MKPKALQNMNQLPIMPGNFLHGPLGELNRLGGGVDSMAQAGYTVTNFVGIEDLPLCEKYGIKAIMVEDQANGWHRRRCLTPEQVKNEADRLICDEKDLDARAKRLVAACKPYDNTVLGYYVIDEPSIQQFPYVRRICDALSRYDNTKMLFVNLLPTYAYPRQLGVDTLFDPSRFTNNIENFKKVQENINYDFYQMYLDEYIRIVNPQDFIRYDNFSVMRMMGADKEKDYAALQDYLRNLHMAYDTAKRQGIDAWIAAPGAQMRYYSSLITPANLALQAYTALCAGFRGIGWHSYYKSVHTTKEGFYGYYDAAFDSQSGDPSVTYFLLREINRQLQLMGVHLMHMTLQKVYYRNADSLVCPTIEQSESSFFETLDCSLNTPLMAGEFKDDTDGSLWVMIVNLNLGYPVALSFTLKPPYTALHKIDLGTGKLLPVEPPHPFCLLPGSGVLCKLLKA